MFFVLNNFISSNVNTMIGFISVNRIKRKEILINFKHLILIFQYHVR